MKNIILACLVIVLSFSCKNSKDEQQISDTTETTSRREFKDLIGSYTDTIPCADCAGIVTTIDLKPDSTYIIESIYLKAPQKNVVNYTLGSWLIKDSIITLSTSTQPVLYKAMGNAEIAMLDANGNEIKNTRFDYTLLKATTPFKPVQNIPVTGLFDGAKDTMHFYLCATKKMYPAAISTNEHQMRSQYDKIKTKDYDTVIASVEGHFELRPTPGSTNTKDYFVIDKLKKLTKGADCAAAQ